MSGVRFIYSCPPDERGSKPWCDALPCHGHRVTQDQLLIARALAFQAGVDLHDIRAERMSYLRTARVILHNLRAPVRA